MPSSNAPLNSPPANDSVRSSTADYSNRNIDAVLEAMPFPASLVAPTLSKKAVYKIVLKVVLKSILKALSKPIVKKTWFMGKIMYKTLTDLQTSSSTEKGSGDAENKATEELSVVIDDLLNQLGTKFSTISEELLGKMDEMSRRLDNLEAAIQAGKGNDGK